ncbi:MAG: folylpolyglutamate synthase/dihydrofolate synthase family protein [Pseudomonadota bacterium]
MSEMPAPQRSAADAAIAVLMENHPKGFDLSLGRITALLDKLDNPHLRLPPVIHVAGTNGKGSTIAFCRALLEAAGLRVHVHTSPHLVNWHERYRLGRKGGGALVDDDVLREAIDRVSDANGRQPITVFEVLSAVAFVLFSEHPADVCLVEVGLGGRLDATNVMPQMAASIITPVAMDHEAFLGDTLAKIAFEKAGIIKPGCPVFVGPQDADALAVIEKQAARQKALACFAGQDFHWEEEAGRLLVHHESGLFDLPLPALPGAHQLANAATALVACTQFCDTHGHTFTNTMAEEAMARVVWPGRMQRLTSGHLVDALGDRHRLWLDGGHNPHAGAALAQTLASLKKPGEQAVMIAGMLNTKDQAGYFESLAGVIDRIFTVPVLSSEAGVPPSDLAETAREAGLTADSTKSLEAAIDAVAGSGQNGPVLIGGSLYLVGDALEANGTPPT